MSVIDPPEKSFGSNGATAKRDEGGRFLSVPGNSPNAGRKKGARARWSEEFMADIEAAWKEQGPTVIARAMFHDPAGTLKALIGILPKHAKLEITTPTDGLSDDQLERLIAYAEAKMAEASTIEGSTITVAPSLPPPLAEAPPTSAEQRAAAVRRDMLDQSDAANAAAHKLPSQEINPEDLF